MFIVQKEFELKSSTIYPQRLKVYDRLDEIKPDEVSDNIVNIPKSFTNDTIQKARINFGWTESKYFTGCFEVKYIKAAEIVPESHDLKWKLYYWADSYGWIDSSVKNMTSILS